MVLCLSSHSLSVRDVNRWQASSDWIVKYARIRNDENDIQGCQQAEEADVV